MNAYYSYFYIQSDSNFLWTKVHFLWAKVGHQGPKDSKANFFRIVYL